MDSDARFPYGALVCLAKEATYRGTVLSEDPRVAHPRPAGTWGTVGSRNTVNGIVSSIGVDWFDGGSLVVDANCLKEHHPNEMSADQLEAWLAS